MILYAIVVLAGMCVVASALGLTPALGALAAGIVLGENRLTHQIDALVLPFREAFSAMFFISLGMLTDFSYVFHHPSTCFLALVGAVAFKALCATFALRACGMDKRGALAFGVSISQIGELAFMLLSVAFNAKAINETTYNTMLFVSVASLVLTPNMVKIALADSTIPHEVIGIFGAGSVLLKPAPEGTGVIAGGAVRAVMEAVGIRNICAKCLRSNNPQNVVKATMAGLTSLRSPEQVAAVRGKSVEEII